MPRQAGSCLSCQTLARMYCCPSCRTSLAQAAVTCVRCGADFGPTSAWRPVLATSTVREQASKERSPSPLNALAAIGVFPIAVPPLGALLLLLSEGPTHSLSFPAVALTLLFSYAFAGAPALGAGLLCAALTGGCVVAFQVARLPSLLAAVFGAVSGAIAMVAKFAITADQLLPMSRGVVATTVLTAVCCSVVAAVAATLFPVGVMSGEGANAG